MLPGVRFFTALAPLLLLGCTLDPFAGRVEPQGGVVHVGLVGGPGGGGADAAGDSSSEPELFILSLSPPRGNPAGGDTVTLSGGGFEKGCDVRFGGAAVRETYFVNPSTLMVITPQGDPGLADVEVVNPGGASTIAADGFLFAAELAITGVSPSRGPIEGGTPVTIQGSGFLQDTTFLVGHRILMQVDILSDGTAVGITPPGDTGGAVAVFAGNLAGAATLEGGYVYTVAPRIDRIVPAMGPVSGGADAVLEGRWLASVNQVWLGGAEALVLDKDNQRITVRTPPGPGEGTVDVRVDGSWGAAVLPAGYTYVDPMAHVGLALLGVHPASGDVAGGNAVELAVCGQVPGAPPAVEFDGTPAAPVTSDPALCRLVVIAPPGEPGPADLRLASGGDVLVAAAAYEYLRSFALQSLAPGMGPVSGGTRVRLEGDGLTGVFAVRFGPLWGSNVEVVDDSQLEVTTPPGVPGLVDVVLVRADGLHVTLPGGFEYVPEDPLVALVDPVFGAQAGGTMVAVVGAGFSPASRVFFGTEEAQDVTFRSPTELWAWTPQGDVGTVDVTVESPLGDATLPQAFSYFDPGAYWGGGTWGGPIDGAVNVTVLDSYEMEPLPEAYVIVGNSASSPWQGRTDERGQITFSGPGFFGPRSVHASKEKHDAASVVDFDAQNVTLYLVPEEPPPDPGPTEPPPEPLPPGRVSGEVVGLGKYVVVPPGSCLHHPWEEGGFCAPCAGDGDCPGGTCQAMSGQGSFCTVSCGSNDDCPGEALCAGGDGEESWCLPPAGRRAVHCEVSRTSIYLGWGMQDELSWLDPAAPFYDLPDTRLGEVAVICFGGYGEAGTGIFVPLAMGIRRHVMVGPGEHVQDQNIHLSIPLTRALRLRMDAPPLFTPGDGYYRVSTYLDLGSDGIADLRQGLDSYTPEDIRFEHLPEELSGDLYDAEYLFLAGAYSNTLDDTPYSVVYLEGITELDAASAWRRSGGLWEPMPAAPREPLRAVCQAPDGLVGVGEDGLAALWDGTSWKAQPRIVGLDLLACAPGPGGTLAVVGEGGAVLLREGGTWSLAGTVTDRSLQGVAWTSDGLLAVGPQRIVRLEDGQWSETKVTFDLRDVAVSGSSAWAVGAEGTILRSEGAVWVQEPSPTTQDLLAVAALPDGHVVAAGAGVVLLRTTGGWTDAAAPSDLRYIALDGEAPNDLWLVARGGALVRRLSDTWEVMRPSDVLEFNDVTVAGGEPVAVGAPALLFTPFQHFPVFSKPLEDGAWSGLRLTWNNGQGPIPSFHTLTLAEETGRSFWRITANGPARDVQLPDFDAAAGFDPVTPGLRRLRTYSIHREGFDVDQFDWSDLSTYGWRAWAYDMILFY